MLLLSVADLRYTSKSLKELAEARKYLIKNPKKDEDILAIANSILQLESISNKIDIYLKESKQC